MFNWLKRKEQPKTEEQVQEQQAAYEEGLQRTKRGFFQQVVSLFEVDEITEDIWEDLETLLIQADLGVDTTVALVERLRDRVRDDRLKKPQHVYEALQDELVAILLKPERDVLARVAASEQRADVQDRPYVILVVGVNGVGKTTTIAKLTKWYRDRGRSVMIGAAAAIIGIDWTFALCGAVCAIAALSLLHFSRRGRVPPATDATVASPV